MPYSSTTVPLSRLTGSSDSFLPRVLKIYKATLHQLVYNNEEHYCLQSNLLLGCLLLLHTLVLAWWLCNLQCLTQRKVTVAYILFSEDYPLSIRGR